MKILHVKDVANVGSTLVAGLNSIGEEAVLYKTIKYRKINFPKFINKLVGVLIALLELCRFSHYIRINHFDIVHIHYGSMAYLPLLTRTSFYLHLHGSDLRKAIHIPITGYFIKLGIKKAEKVFYSTPDLEKLIKPLRSDALFFPNPLEIEKFVPKQKTSASTAIDIFSISKIDKNKGIEVILSSIENLIEDDRVSSVLMFGIGNDVENFSEIIDHLRSINKVKIIDQVPHKEMVKLINGAKIILGQMSLGSIGCSELEAMACAKPVVCKFQYWSMYNTPPPLVSVSTMEEAIKEILELLHNPRKAKRIGFEARKWVEENCNNITIARQLLDIYQSRDRLDNKSLH